MILSLTVHHVEETWQRKGKCLHILDLIFGEIWQEKGVAPPAEPSVAQENKEH